MALRQLDSRLLIFARTRGHSAAAERVISAYSRLGEHAACWLALGAGGALLDRTPERRARWRRGILIVATGYGCNYAIKISVRRRRPELEGLPPLTPTVSRLSFPSAHATTSFAAAAAYGGLLPPSALYVLAAAFALSRPYLGVHYPSDVLAGALIGAVLARLWPDEHESGWRW